jgi:hypothetical protein
MRQLTSILSTGPPSSHIPHIRNPWANLRLILFPVMVILLALMLLLNLISPVFADKAPSGASNNAINISIAADPSPTPPGYGPYHKGDKIVNVVTVDVPLFVGPALIPAWQSGVTISFDPIIDDPANPNMNNPVDDTVLGVGLDFLPGEGVIYTPANAHFKKYREEAGKPTRAQLTQTNSSFAMPIDANFDEFDVPGSYPVLNHTIGTMPPGEVAASEMFFQNGIWQISAVARILNMFGAHSSSDHNDSNDKLTSITIPIAVPNTIVTITSNATEVDAGQSVLLTVTENNTGNVNLNSPHVKILKNGALFADLAAPPHSGDTYTPAGVLNGSMNDQAEVWLWTLDSGPINETTVFTATGHGLEEGSGRDITYLNGYPDERASIIISPKPGGPPPVPAATDIGLVFLVAGLSGGVLFFSYRRAHPIKR